MFLNVFETLSMPRKVTFQFKCEFQKVFQNHSILSFHVFDTGTPLFPLAKKLKAHWTKVHLKKHYPATVQRVVALFQAEHQTCTAC